MSSGDTWRSSIDLCKLVCCVLAHEITGFWRRGERLALEISHGHISFELYDLVVLFDASILELFSPDLNTFSNQGRSFPHAMSMANQCATFYSPFTFQSMPIYITSFY